MAVLVTSTTSSFFSGPGHNYSVVEMASGEEERSDEDRIIEVLIIEGQNRQYEDTDFMPVKHSLYLSEKHVPDYDIEVPYLVWCRPSQINEQASYFTPAIPDVPYCAAMGTLPDQVFLGVLMAVSAYQKQDLISNIFASRPEDFNTYGVYTCRFYVEGSWVDVITDTNIPCLRDPNTGAFSTAYGFSPNEGEMWVALAEKAYAKAVGCYESLQKVKVREVLMHLTGGSIQQISLREEVANDDDVSSLLWQSMTRALRHDTLIVCEPATKEEAGPTNGATDTDAGGEGEMKMGSTMGDGGEGSQMYDDTDDLHSLQVDRLYSVVDMITIEGHELVLLHDPWSKPGETCWHGDWSHNSKTWDLNNGEIQDAIDADTSIPWTKDRPQGFFWMPFKNFKSLFNTTYMCKLFPDEKFNFYSLPGDWVHTEAGGPPVTVREKHLVVKQANESRTIALNKNTCAVVVDGDSSFFNNPQFRITCNKPTRIYVSLVPLSAESLDGASHNAITITSMPRAPGTPLRVWDLGTAEIVATDKVETGGRIRGQEVSVWNFHLDPRNYYHIIPHTMRKGQEGAFFVRLYSSDGLVVEKLDKVSNKVVPGLWQRVGDLDTTGGPPRVASQVATQGAAAPVGGGATGGLEPEPSLLAGGEEAGADEGAAPAAVATVENSKWCQNPQYHLEIIDPFAKEDIFLKVVVRRKDKGATEPVRRSMISDKAEPTVGLVVAKADALEDLAPQRQKKGPRQNALGQFIASKPSSLKKKRVVDEDKNPSSSESGKTILRKTTLPASGYCQMSTFGSKGDACIYYPRLPRSWIGNGLIIVPCLTEKGLKGQYDLEVFSSEPVLLKMLPDSYSRSIAGEWSAPQDGGNHLSTRWKQNPKYLMKFRNSSKGNPPARVRITLSKHGDRWDKMSRKDTVGCMIGFYIFIQTSATLPKEEGKDGEAKPPTPAPVPSGDMRQVYESVFCPNDRISTDADFMLEQLSPDEEYVIMPTTFAESKRGAFVLSIGADYEYTIVKDK
jgi:hypothetical protein